MDIENLTLKQIKEIAAVASTLGGTTPTTPHHAIGQRVLIRDHMAGVFIGTLDMAAGKSWRLRDCRKIHYWTKAAATEGLAVVGDTGSGGRVCPMLAWEEGHDMVQMQPVTEASYRRLVEAPVWTP